MASLRERLFRAASRKIKEEGYSPDEIRLGSSSHQATQCRDGNLNDEVVITWLENNEYEAVAGVMHHTEDKRSSLYVVDPYNPDAKALIKQAKAVQAEYCNRNCEDGCVIKKRRKWLPW